MKHSQTMAPPLSPFLLAGLAMRPLPPKALQPLLSFAMRAVLRRHPGLLDRLSNVDNPVYLIDATDLPFVFVLRPAPLLPTLTAHPDDQGLKATAAIRGPLMTLISLLEGRIDGDAMFFQRDLVIEGDTEAVVALRNAVDGAEIDVAEDVLAFLGPLGGLTRMGVNLGGAVLEQASDDLKTLQDSLIAPAIKENQAQAAAIREMQERLQDLGRAAGRAQSKERAQSRARTRKKSDQ